MPENRKPCLALALFMIGRGLFHLGLLPEYYEPLYYLRQKSYRFDLSGRQFHMILYVN